MTDDAVAQLLAADASTMSYEQARDGLAAIVHRLESGAASLEESLTLWEKGEALAARCTEWLDSAQQRLTAAGSVGDDEESAVVNDIPF